MNVFYVHHACRDVKDELSQEDGITDLGEQDARTTAATFAGLKKYYNCVAIYTSPLKRCRLTAEIIAKAIKVPIIEDARLDEFKAVPGETWVDCQRRVMAALKDIVYAHRPSDAVLCVTSGVNLSAFIAAAYGLAPSEHMPFAAVTMCSPIGFDIGPENFERQKKPCRRGK